jgi:hypothetical protein
MAPLIYKENEHIMSAMSVNFCRDVFIEQIKQNDPLLKFSIA